MVKASPQAASEKTATAKTGRKADPATVARATPRERSTATLFGSTEYFGFIQGGDWHSDAERITWLLAQYQAPTIDPSLRIRSGNAIDRVQMTLHDPSGKDYPLTRFGGDGGTESIIDARRLRNILQVKIWATKPGRYHSQRFGCIRISYTAQSGYSEQTFGKYDDELLGSFDVDGRVPLGFTGNSGSMVDGLAFLLASG